MTRVKIYVSRDKKTGQLHLRDSEGHAGDGSITTVVHPGDKVEWMLGKGLDEITGISPVSGSQNIFDGKVHKNGHGSWKGTVSELAQGSEEYTIQYVAENKTESDNPKLKVKPPKK